MIFIPLYAMPQILIHTILIAQIAVSISISQNILEHPKAAIVLTVQVYMAFLTALLYRFGIVELPDEVTVMMLVIAVLGITTLSSPQAMPTNKFGVRVD